MTFDFGGIVNLAHYHYYLSYELKTYDSELPVEVHVITEFRYIVEEMCLHMGPHMWEPGKVFVHFQEQPVSCVLVFVPWKRENDFL